MSGAVPPIQQAGAIQKAAAPISQARKTTV